MGPVAFLHTIGLMIHFEAHFHLLTNGDISLDLG